MTRPFTRALAYLLPLAAVPGALALGAAPALAQEEGGDRVNTLIIYGDDECPKSEGNEIVVCARLDEGERYRIPERLRQSGDPANESWAEKVQAYETVGDFGPMSCSPVGAGGALGCTAKMIEAAYAERARSSDVRFSLLIEEERAERLSTIDEEAADTQARVEELERQYDERMRRAQEGDETDAADPAADAPAEANTPAAPEATSPAAPAEPSTSSAPAAPGGSGL